MEYDLELERAAREIKQHDAKLVCIQLPDGLKPKAQEIVDYLQEHTNARIITWLGSCYGACDVPLEANRVGADLIIQWGHSAWKATTSRS